MLILFGVFAVGFASDFLIVKYYKALENCRPHRAVVFNSLIFLINVIFIDLVQGKNSAMLAVFLVGQSAGIEAAMWLNDKNNVVEK